MYTLATDEKVTPVMAYTQDSLIRGEAVTKQPVRVSTWFRTEGAPDYLHIYNVQWVTITGGALKPLTFPETFVPLDTIIGFHILPPQADPLDYDEREANRVNAPLSVLMGRLLVKGRMRVSPQTDIGTSLSISHTKWMSLYESEITSPHLSQMPAMQVPMLIVRPKAVTFILETT
ncbi:MAG: hypothetical protein HFACDABA_02643 [Anaerolineales bacterium]|nr:hypothetical protein [Anaerolineales bacterium]